MYNDTCDYGYHKIYFRKRVRYMAFVSYAVFKDNQYNSGGDISLEQTKIVRPEEKDFQERMNMHPFIKKRGELKTVKDVLENLKIENYTKANLYLRHNCNLRNLKGFNVSEPDNNYEPCKLSSNVSDKDGIIIIQ